MAGFRPPKSSAGQSADAAAVAFEQFGDRVYRFLLKRSRSHHDAEDLTQQVFVEAAKALRDRHVEPSSMLAWLFTVAQRRFTDEIRRRALAERTIGLAPSGAEGDYGSQVAASLRGAIGRLPRDQQVVVVRKVIQGLSYAEIADELAITVEACRMRLSRALATLRADLEREGLGSDGA
jgi:RNA polymerase sigma-70 factor, ECF subfamily